MSNQQQPQEKPLSKKETLQVAESLLLMQELGRLVVNSQEVAQEIQDQAKFIQQMMQALQGR